MHTRQSGAAHVPIMFFLIVLVLFLGVLGFAYVATDANTNLHKDNVDLRAQVSALNGKALLFTHYIEDLGKVIDLPGKYTGRSSVSAELYGGETLDGIAGVVNPADMSRKIVEFGTSVDIAATRGIDDLFSAVNTKVAALKQRTGDIEGERDKSLTEKVALDTSFRSAQTDHAQKASEFGRNLEQSRADYEASKSTKDGTIAQLQQNLRDKAAESEAAKEAFTAEKKQLQGEIGRLVMHNTALVNKDKLRVPPDVADGKVIVARSGIPTAFINLGRKDMLQPGTVFRIKNPHHEAIKGYATVVRVEQEKAEVELSGVVEPLADAVREGDLLYNDLYSPGRASKRVIHLMGRFSYPYNKEPLQTLLENLGNTMVGKMGPGVDTVILGDNPINESGDGFSAVEESEEYKLANGLGVEFVPLRKIRDLLKL